MILVKGMETMNSKISSAVALTARQCRTWLFSRPNVLLEHIGRPHKLDDIFRLLLRDASLLRDNLTESSVNLPRHMSGVTANIEDGLLLQEFVDLDGHLLQSMLDVNFVGSLSRKSGHQLEVIAKIFFVLLGQCQRSSVKRKI